MEHETDFFGGVLKIALGLFLGALLIWMAIECVGAFLRAVTAVLE